MVGVGTGRTGTVTTGAKPWISVTARGPLELFPAVGDTWLNLVTSCPVRNPVTAIAQFTSHHQPPSVEILPSQVWA